MSKEEGQESVVNGYKIFLPSSDRMVSAWSRGDMAVQEKYMQMCLAAVDEAVIKIKEGEKDLWSLFTFLAGKRAEIAQELNHADKESIGILREARDSNMETPLDDAINSQAGNRYADQFSALKARFLKLITDDSICVENDKHTKSVQIRCPTQGHEHTLISKICLEDEGEEKESLEIHHTVMPNDYFFQSEIGKLEEKYEFFEDGVEEEKLYHQLGNLTWHLAHFMPCKRGTASITDMLAKTILKYHRKNLYPFKTGINWDLEAIFTSNPDDFANRYFNLFERDEQTFLKRYATYANSNPSSSSSNTSKRKRSGDDESSDVGMRDDEDQTNSKAPKAPAGAAALLPPPNEQARLGSKKAKTEKPSVPNQNLAGEPSKPLPDLAPI